ncbi:isoform 3 of syndetin, partial [Fagus crenata]
MQPNLFPFGTVLGNPYLFNGDLSEGLESSRVFFLVPFLLFQGGGMDLSKVGEKILSSVRSARSLGLLPSTSDRPEVPPRAAAAAAIAHALAGLPPHQRFNLPSSSEELRSIYGIGTTPHGQVVEELEEDYYEEDFDPVRHILEHIPSDENDLTYFEKQAALRLAQLDKVAERLSHHVMEHHEVMVKGMNLVRELEKDLKIANVICMNGRRHLTSSVNEVSRDLIVNSNSKKKQALLDMLPILTELCNALKMQAALESLAEEGNYCKAFQVLSEYLQLLDSFSELSAIQEMSQGVEVWLGKTLQKLDSLLLGVCQEFKEEGYITVVDAYALIGDVSGLSEKIQSFFMQEVLSETHSVLKNIVQEDQEVHIQNTRLTYSDLCLWIPESKFRQCLLTTLAVLFRLMCSYYEIMGFQLDNKDSMDQTSSMKQKEKDIPWSSGEVQQIDSDTRKSCNGQGVNGSLAESVNRMSGSSMEESTTTSCLVETNRTTALTRLDSQDIDDETRKDDRIASSSGSPWYQLRKDATAFVSQTLQRGRKNLWQLTTSRVSVLLSSAAVCSTSIHQFLKNYEDLNVFILAGEAFCGVEAVEFRQKLKVVCETYFIAFHRQNIYALKMVLEKENWLKLPPDTVQVISFAGLVGDGAPLIVPSVGNSSSARVHRSDKSESLVDNSARSGFLHWLKSGNPFLLKVTYNSKEGHNSLLLNGAVCSDFDEIIVKIIMMINLLADFIDEDSQLPSRISKPNLPRSQWINMQNMQKLEIVNVEFFKTLVFFFFCLYFCLLMESLMLPIFQIGFPDLVYCCRDLPVVWHFFYFIFETFVQQNPSSNRQKTALSRITQDCDQWINPSPHPPSLNTSFMHADVTLQAVLPVHVGLFPGTSERCAGADTLSLLPAKYCINLKSISNRCLQNNATIVEDFLCAPG